MSMFVCTTLVLRAHCPVCFPALTHLIQMNGCYQALQKPDINHSFELGVLDQGII